jgi:hypothetical protein
MRKNLQMSRFRRNYDDAGGARKGALGKFDPGAKLDRNYDPWNPKVLTDDLSDGKGKYTSNDVSFLNRKPSDTPRYDPTGSEKVKDIYDDVARTASMTMPAAAVLAPLNMASTNAGSEKTTAAFGGDPSEDPHRTV